MSTGKEAKIIAREINSFLNDYAPNHLTSSGHTLKGYRIGLKLYVEFLENVKKVTSKTLCGTCFSRSYIEEWMIYLRDSRGCQPGTCNIRLTGIRRFLEYLGSRHVEFKYLYYDSKDIPLMKTVKKHANGITRTCIRQLILTPDQYTVTGIRDVTYIVLAYDTGARISELLNIRLKDIHIGQSNERSYINVIGKGNKIRTLVLKPRTVGYLKRFIDVVHHEPSSEEDYLFYSRNDKSRKTPICDKTIDKRLKLYAAEAHEDCVDMPLDLHSHTLRHSMATHLLEDGINIVQISQLLGHENIETTMKYLDVTTDDVKKYLLALEDEEDRKAKRKWKDGKGTLLHICGL